MSTGLQGIRVNDVGNEELKNPLIPDYDISSVYAQKLKNRDDDTSEYFALNGNFGKVKTYNQDTDGSLADYGDSRYDSDVTFNLNPDKLQNNRFDEQSAVTQIASGVAKGVVTTGTTFGSIVGGLTLGVAEGIKNLNDDKPETGFWTGVWNNEISKAMREINDASEEIFKNYYSTNQERSPWYSWDNVMSANFIGDKIIKNFGFMTGTFGAGAVLTAAKLLPKLTFKSLKTAGLGGKTALRTAKAVSAIEGSTISAIGEAGIEALNKAEDFRKEEYERVNLETDIKIKDIDTRLANLEFVKNSMEINQYLATKANLEAEKASVEDARNKTLAQIDKDAIRSGNITFGLNIPLLLGSNIISWGKLYSKGFKSATKYSANNIGKNAAKREGSTQIEQLINSLENNIKRPTVKGVAKTAHRMITEGNEEMSQSAISEFAGIQMQQDIDNYYKAALDGAAYKETFDTWKNVMEAIHNTYGNGDTWEEFAIGSISSLFGMPTVRNVRNDKGKFQIPITFQGGVLQDLKDAKNEYTQAQKIIDDLKKRLEDPKFIETFEGMTAHNYWQNAMDRAAELNNKKFYKDKETSQFLSDLTLLHQAGILENAESIIELAGDVSDITTEEGRNNLEMIKDNDKIKDENGNIIGSQRGWFRVNKNGAYEQFTSDEDIAKEITERKDKLLKYIKQYRQVITDLDFDTDGSFSDDQINELAWLQMKVYDGYTRNGEILTDIQYHNMTPLYNILDDQKNDGKLTDEQYNKMLDVLESFNNLDFKDLTDEKWSRLIRKNPNLVGTLEYFKNLDSRNFKNKELKQQFLDIFELQKDISNYSKTFNEFRENPGLLRAQIDQIRMDARKKQVDEYAKQKEDELSKANDLNEFASVYNEAQFAFTLFNDDENEINKKWFDDYLNQSSNPKVKEYLSRMRRVDKYYDSYNNAVSKINNNDLSEFSDDEQQLLSFVDLNSEYIATQISEIFSPLEDGLDFDETKKHIQENITNKLKNPNTILNKELEVLANHILNKLKQAEKINQSQQTKQPDSQTSKEQTKPKRGSLLYDYDSEGNPVSQETEDAQESSEPEPIPDEAQDIISNTRKSIDLTTNHLNNNETTEAEKEFKNLEKLLQRLNKYSNIESAKQTISDLVDLSDILKSKIEKLKLKSNSQTSKQQVTSEQTENQEDNLLTEVKEEHIDIIENLSNTDIQDILNGNPKSENAKEFVNNVLNRSNELTKNKLISLLETRLVTSTTNSDIVIPDDTKDNTSDDAKTFNDVSDVTIEGINTSENNNDSRNNLIGNVIFKPEGIVKLRSDKQKNNDIVKPQHQSFFDRFNIENFINKGLLATLANEYKTSHDGNNIPIHFLANSQFEDDTSRYPRRQPIFAIEITDVNRFNTLTESKLGAIPELVEIDGKKYYPLGPVYFYKNKNENYTNLQTLMYAEGILYTDNGPDWNVSKYTTELANIFKGKLYTSTEDVSEATRPISQTGFNDPKTLTFGVKNRTGEVISPQTTEDVEPLAPNVNSRLGSTWLLVRGADGKLYPTATKIARFNSTEYDWRTKDTPVIQKMKELAAIICDSSKPLTERLESKYLFERILGFPTDIQGRVENPIKITDIDGKDIITIKPRTGFKIPSISGETIEEKVESFIDAMSTANYKFNISISELRGSKLFNTQEEYLQFVIDSDIIFTNLIEPSFTSANFEVYPLNENGDIVKTEIVNVQERNRTDRNINTTANTNIQYSLANGFVGFFEYDDAGNPIGELTTEMKKAASDIYTLLHKEYEYEEQNGEYHGGIYHKDGTDYYIQLSGSHVYTIYFKNDGGYNEIVKAYNKARKKDSPENNALNEMQKNLDGIGKTGNQVVQDSNENSTVQQDTGLSATLPDEFKNDPMTFMLSRADDDFIRVANMLGGDGYELTDDEVIALLELKKCGLDFNVVNNIDDLNKLRDDAQRCHGGGSFRFKDRKPPVNNNGKQKKGKRTPGINAKKFEEND